MFNELALTPLDSIRAIQGWEEFLEDGRGYLQTATEAFRKERTIFTPAILYNLSAMAIEKFVMAALMYRGTMPYNHTMTDLVEAMEENFPGAITHMREGLLRLDTYQDICDPYHFKVVEPARDAIPAMLHLAEQMQNLAEEITAAEAACTTKTRST